MTVKQTVHIEQVVEKRTLVGEGSLWDADKSVLYWVDILSHEVIYTIQSAASIAR